jgi:ribosomal protein S18 acetylase RimI-like enzyme
MSGAYQFEVRRVTAAETRPLRQRVLRPHQRLEEVGYAGDGVPGAAHFGAFVHLHQRVAMVGTGTIHPEGEPGWWRLRGMATDEAHRNGGLGSALVHAILAHVAAEGGRVVWCNARARAAAFYRRHGFTVEGEPFELPEIGAHVYMLRAL